MGSGRGGRLGAAAAGFVVFDAGVLVLVAVDAEQLTVARVGRVVVVVTVLVVHGELAQARGGEFAGAAGADPGEELEGLLAVLGAAHRAILPRRFLGWFLGSDPDF